MSNNTNLSKKFALWQALPQFQIKLQVMPLMCNADASCQKKYLKKQRVDSVILLQL